MSVQYRSARIWYFSLHCSSSTMSRDNSASLIAFSSSKVVAVFLSSFWGSGRGANSIYLSISLYLYIHIMSLYLSI